MNNMSLSFKLGINESVSVLLMFIKKKAVVKFHNCFFQFLISF